MLSLPPEGDLRIVQPERLPLIGRPGHLGIKIAGLAFHKEHGIELNNYSVPYEWWKDGKENIYDDNWQREGFIEVNRDPIYGDMCMFRLQSVVTNHAGIYLGDNQLLHHMSGKLSRKDIFSGWYQDHIVRVVRHKDLPEELKIMQNLVRIKLSGSLGRRFGVFHEMAVESWPECIRAMSSQIEGFKSFFQSEVGSRMKYAIFCDGKTFLFTTITHGRQLKRSELSPFQLAQSLEGYFRSFWVQVAAFYTGGASLAAMGALSSSAFMMGGAMVLGGVMQMISPQAGGAKMQSTSAANKPSYAFGGAVNTTAAGYPVPLPYGERTVGGAIFSAGSYAEDKI
ncbi:tail assembly protein [Citrobacter phage HCF1]|uniref:Tail assembly protein n=1 Tax=Citrobacter phage HCF1 TaxID=2849700 RepID=A0ABX6D3M7_9CAUD|nr:tail assembly protein [Citrobacter phage HCF1]